MSKPRICIIGAGLYGLHLARAFHNKCKDITIYEKTCDILQGASHCNHYRIHYGFHYLNNIKTIDEIQRSLPQFLKEYSFCIEDHIPQYYHIHEDSNMTKYKLNSVMNWMNEYNDNIAEWHETEPIEHSKYSILTNEKFLNYDKLYRYYHNFIKLKDNIYLRCNNRLTNVHELSKHYDYVFTCAYSNNNDKLLYNKRKYKYQLIEKPIIRWKHKPVSHIFIDGDYASIGPHWNKYWFVLGNVKHAIHQESIEYDNPFKLYQVNSGLIPHMVGNKFKDFEKDMNELFPFVKDYDYVGSMFTVKVLDQKNEKERLFAIDKHHDNTFNVFSSKLSTCVLVEDELREMIEEFR